MAAIDTIVLMMTFGLSIIFSLIAITNKEKSEYHYKLLSAICWFIFAVVFFVTGQAGSALVVYPITVLWLGLGLLFTIIGIQDFFNMKRDKIWGFNE